MTDWKLIAQARSIDQTNLESAVAVLQQLESTLAGLKLKMPFDIEPAPAFQPAEYLEGRS